MYSKMSICKSSNGTLVYIWSDTIYFYLGRSYRISKWPKFDGKIYLRPVYNTVSFTKVHNNSYFSDRCDMTGTRKPHENGFHPRDNLRYAEDKLSQLRSSGIFFTGNILTIWGREEVYDQDILDICVYNRHNLAVLFERKMMIICVLKKDRVRILPDTNFRFL
jgi:hypothetical protein